MLKRAIVDLTLSEMCEAIRCNRCLIFPRKENMNTLTQLGMTSQQAFEEIMKLSYVDYVSGPDQDWDRPDEEPLWIFRKTVQNEVLYIKFKFYFAQEDEKGVKFISFHIERNNV